MLFYKSLCHCSALFRAKAEGLANELLDVVVTRQACCHNDIRGCAGFSALATNSILPERCLSTPCYTVWLYSYQQWQLEVTVPKQGLYKCHRRPRRTYPWPAPLHMEMGKAPRGTFQSDHD